MQVPAFDTAELGDSHTLWCQATDSDGSPSSGTNVSVNIYDDSSHSQMSLALSPSESSETGLFYAALDASGANGFERGKSYLVRWEATVSAEVRSGVGRLHIT